MKDIITLAEGAGGKEMSELIRSFDLKDRFAWKNTSDDSASYLLPDGTHLVFTTDSFIVDPLFFPGGNIGDLAFSGTVNDLLMMGASPKGISVALVIEEGLRRADLKTIISTMKQLSRKTGIAIATGDTKVMEKGKIDKLIITTSGVGIAKSLLDGVPKQGDSVVISGGIGEHATAILSTRFDFSTSIISDSKPLLEEMDAVRAHLIRAKDPTRGGIASALNEISQSAQAGMLIEEASIPLKEGVRTAARLLGIDPYLLACEGRFICVTRNPEQVVSALKAFDSSACVIGKIIEGDQVLLQTTLGTRILPVPTGRIVPRIC